VGPESLDGVAADEIAGRGRRASLRRRVSVDAFGAGGLAVPGNWDVRGKCWLGVRNRVGWVPRFHCFWVGGCYE
jgi:hypothetical protein